MTERYRGTTIRRPDRESGDRNLFGRQSAELRRHAGVVLSVANQNVDEVLPGADDQTRENIKHHYGKRAGALDYSADHIGALVTANTPDIAAQTTYLSDVLGRPFNAYTAQDLRRRQHDTLIVPYINTGEAEARLIPLGQEVWGLPSTLVNAIKDKATFHELVKEAQIPGMEVPDFTIADKSNIADQANAMLAFSERLYKEHDNEEHDMSETYPRGVVIRSAHSDGNYGMALIKQNEDTGEIEYLPDGKKADMKTFKKDAWAEATNQAQSDLRKTVKGDARFVVSRFIDRGDEPGNSFIMTDGTIESVGWNGQIITDGGTACVGTSDYETAIKEYAKAKTKQNGIGEAQILAQKRAQREQYEKQTADAFINFFTYVAEQQGLNIEELSGAFNADIMLPGPLEKELRRRRGQPDVAYVAESNPRWTNYTDAVMLAVGAKGLSPTVNSFKVVSEGGLVSIDAYKSQAAQRGNSPDLTIVRNELLGLNEEARRDGTGGEAIMRMPDDEAQGVIFTGNLQAGKIIYERAAERAA